MALEFDFIDKEIFGIMGRPVDCQKEQLEVVLDFRLVPNEIPVEVLTETKQKFRFVYKIDWGVSKQGKLIWLVTGVRRERVEAIRKEIEEADNPFKALEKFKKLNDVPPYEVYHLTEDTRSGTRGVQYDDVQTVQNFMRLMYNAVLKDKAVLLGDKELLVLERGRTYAMKYKPDCVSEALISCVEEALREHLGIILVPIPVHNMDDIKFGLKE